MQTKKETTKAPELIILDTPCLKESSKYSPEILVLFHLDLNLWAARIVRSLVQDMCYGTYKRKFLFSWSLNKNLTDAFEKSSAEPSPRLLQKNLPRGHSADLQRAADSVRHHSVNPVICACHSANFDLPKTPTVFSSRQPKMLHRYSTDSVDREILHCTRQILSSFPPEVPMQRPTK
jgi:hypothetical protein